VCREFPRSTIRYIRFPLPVSPSEIIPHKGSHVPEIALIREKTALLFWESFNSLSIRLSGAEPKLKITANSTYWEANLRSNGLEQGEVVEIPLFTFSRIVTPVDQWESVPGFVPPSTSGMCRTTSKKTGFWGLLRQSALEHADT
jgi:hypothetical protein